MFEQVSLDLGGRKLTLETGKMARQAHGAIVARYGDSVVLATACMDNKATEKDFLPLTVDYREYTYAAGKIPGGFFKREGRPSEREILTSRLTDRPLRPLFPEGWATETQIIAMVLSADSDNDPDVVAVTAASAALYISKIPFNNPIACVRVGMLEGKLVVNPTIAEQKVSQMNIIIAGSADAIVMVESGAFEVSEDTVADALEFGHAEIRKIVAAIRDLGSRVNPTKVTVKPPAFDEALYKEITSKYGERLRDALDTAEAPEARKLRPRGCGQGRDYGGYRRRGLREAQAGLSRVRAAARAHLPRRHADSPPTARMAARSTKCGRLRAKWACCPARTARRYLRAARRRRWQPPRSARRKTSSGSTCCSSKTCSSGSCCTTTSRRSRWAK